MNSALLKSFTALFIYASSGVRLRDKLIVLVSLIIGKVGLFFDRRLLKNESTIYGNYLVADALVRTNYGTFFCRKASGDLSIILFSERALRGFFVAHAKGDFVDVGANIGLYTVMMAKQLGHSGTVIAFEPDHDNFEMLKKNTHLNGLCNVILYNVGLWSEKGQLPLFVDPKNPTLKATLTLRPAQKSDNPQVVRVDTLDHIVEEIGASCNLIKIDVEGVEAEVLRGAIQTLNRFKPDVIFECLEDRKLNSIERLLRPMGYLITGTHQEGYYVASVKETGAEL